MCYEFRYDFCLKHFSFEEELREIWSKMYIGPQVKYPQFSSDCNETWKFLNRFPKNTKIPNFTKIRPVWAELFHAQRRTNGQTDMTKLVVAFRKTCERASKLFHSTWYFVP